MPTFGDLEVKLVVTEDHQAYGDNEVILGSTRPSSCHPRLVEVTDPSSATQTRNAIAETVETASNNGSQSFVVEMPTPLR
jgi:hypothetical protein